MATGDPTCPICGDYLVNCVNKTTGKPQCRHAQMFGHYGYYQQIEDRGKMINSLKRLELALHDHITERKDNGKYEVLPNDIYDVLEESVSTQTMVKLANIILKLKTNK